MVLFLFNRLEELLGGDGEVVVLDEDLHVLAIAVELLGLLEIVEVA